MAKMLIVAINVKVNDMSCSIKRLKALILVGVSLLIVACSPFGVDEVTELTTPPFVETLVTSTPLSPTASSLPLPTATPQQINTPLSTLGSVTVSSPVTAIDMGIAHGLALLENGDVLGWGAANILGLSEDSKAVQSTPTLLPEIHNIKEIYTNDPYSFFIDEAGRIHELSFFERGERSIFPDMAQVQQVAVGRDETILALKEDGSVWVWGAGQEGQLGTGELDSTDQFIKVPIDGVIEVMFSRSLAFAIRENGMLWVWGTDEEVTGSQETLYTPQQLPGIQDVISIALGDGVNILHTDGTVTVWAEGEFNSVSQLPPIIQIDGNNQMYNLGVAEDGTIWAWGSAWPSAVYGNVNEMPYDRTYGPERFQGHQIDLKDVVQVSTDQLTILALDKNGTVWSWGRTGQYGEGGTGVVNSNISEPTPIIVEE